MTPHRIRLAGFWVESAAADGGTAHTRRFGRPTVRDAGDQVWLVTDVAGEVRVNGVLLGLGTAFRVDLHLDKRNTAKIVLNAGQSLGEVAIEIRTS